MAWRSVQGPGQDLCGRVLADAGRPTREVAARFGVSASYVAKARQRLRDQGDAASRPRRNRVPLRLARHEEALRAEVARRLGSRGRPERPRPALRFIGAKQAAFPIAAMSRALGVSEAGHPAQRRRSPPVCAVADEALLKRIRIDHAESRGTRGAPHVHAGLRAEGRPLGHNRTARLMREACLAGINRRSGPRTTMRGDAEARSTPDLVARDFMAEKPDRLWVADISYLPT